MFSFCRPTPPNPDMAGLQRTTRPSLHRSGRTACREHGRRTDCGRGARKWPVTRAEALGGSWADTAALRAGRRERRPRVRGGLGSELPPGPRGIPRGRGAPSGGERGVPAAGPAEGSGPRPAPGGGGRTGAGRRGRSGAGGRRGARGAVPGRASLTEVVAKGAFPPQKLPLWNPGVAGKGALWSSAGFEHRSQTPAVSDVRPFPTPGRRERGKVKAEGI